MLLLFDDYTAAVTHNASQWAEKKQNCFFLLGDLDPI